MLAESQGKILLRLARRAIESVFEKKHFDFEREKKEFSEKQGVFVTLTKHGELRGCVGFPYPVKPLAEAVVEAARAAAFRDIRFKPLQEKELEHIKIEISVLTEPKLIQAAPQDIPRSIEIGKDGLIIQLSGFSGLLLPQVALEHKWNALEFLRATCIKAGLPPESWLNPNCKIFKFQAQIFSEKTEKS